MKKFGSIAKYLANTTDYTEDSAIQGETTAKTEDYRQYKMVNDNIVIVGRDGTGEGDPLGKSAALGIDKISKFLEQNEYSLKKIVEANEERAKASAKAVEVNEDKEDKEDKEEEGSENLEESILGSVNAVKLDAKEIMKAAQELFHGSEYPGYDDSTYDVYEVIQRNYDGIASFNSALNNLKEGKPLRGNVYASNGFSIEGITEGDQFLVVGDQAKGGSSLYFVENTDTNMKSVYLAGFLRVQREAPEEFRDPEICPVFATNLINVNEVKKYKVTIPDAPKISNLNSILINANFPTSYPDLERALGYSNIRTYSAEEFSAEDGKGGPAKLSPQGDWFLKTFSSFYNNDSKVSVKIHPGTLIKMYQLKVDPKTQAIKNSNKIKFQPDVGSPNSYIFVSQIEERSKAKEPSRFQFNAFTKYVPFINKNILTFNKQEGDPRSGISALNPTQKGFVNPYVVKSLYDNQKGQELRLYFKCIAYLCFMELNKNTILANNYLESVTKIERKLAELTRLAFEN